MCTLILAHRWYQDWPLLVAANRDEALDRPADPPRLDTQDGLQFLAPRDAVAGGTWLGLNAAGLFVGITNRFGVPVDAARPSRGALVARALAHDRATDAFEALRTLDGGGQNGFHLVLADLQDAFLIRGDGETLVAEPLPPGQHVITERSFEAGPTRRDPWVHRQLGQARGTVAPPLEDWQAILCARAEPTFEGVLVEWPERNYGTRSSTIVTLSSEDARFLHAHGRPDVTPFEDLSATARGLLGR